jgi:hypothetical protein
MTWEKEEEKAEVARGGWALAQPLSLRKQPPCWQLFEQYFLAKKRNCYLQNFIFQLLTPAKAAFRHSLDL